jgi:hypothetical protein
MRAARLQDALERLTAAIRDVESELAAMKAEHDPLASHIFVSRRSYRNVNDTKSGKRREMTRTAEFQYCLRVWLLRQLLSDGPPLTNLNRFFLGCSPSEVSEKLWI